MRRTWRGRRWLSAAKVRRLSLRGCAGSGLYRRGAQCGAGALGAGATTQGARKSERVRSAGVLQNAFPRLHRDLGLSRRPLRRLVCACANLLALADMLRADALRSQPRTTAGRHQWLGPSSRWGRESSACRPVPPMGQTRSGTDPDPPFRGMRVGVRRPTGWTPPETLPAPPARPPHMSTRR